MFSDQEYRATYTRKHLIPNTIVLLLAFLANTSCRWISASICTSTLKTLLRNHKTSTGIGLFTFNNNITVSLPIHYTLYKLHVRDITRGIKLNYLE